MKKWKKKELKRLHDLLSLERYDIQAFDHKFKPKKDGTQTFGVSRVNSKYLWAQIWLDENIPSDSNTIAHEMLHVLFGELDHAVYEEIIRSFVPKEFQAHARSTYEHHMEQVVEQLSRAITKK